jgi:thiol-disulfide isomerase/thioredoxin
MRDSLNLDPGLVGDLITSQTFCNRIVDELSPLDDADLAKAISGIADPFVSAYVVHCNNQTKAKIEANKHQKGFVLNETPRTDADKVFDAIMQKYRGKMVYVDFWATWCSPCRSGIERIKPLKEEMDSTQVVFVYITNPSSPLETYKNMIPNIKGEHYRLTQDEWNFLSSKFNITGIPHYVLVGKQGEVIEPHLKFLSNPEIKQLLMRHINGQ